MNFEDHCVYVMHGNSHMEVVCFDWEKSGLLQDRISNRGIVISLRFRKSPEFLEFSREC